MLLFHPRSLSTRSDGGLLDDLTIQVDGFHNDAVLQGGCRGQ